MSNLASKLLLGFVLSLGVVTTSHAQPVQNVDPARHGNLAAAQRLARQSYDELSQAQRDNREGLGGHAERAKRLLEQASEEMKLAAEFANRH